MSEKTKRKSNLRRRLLIRLLFGIVLIIALISAGMYALRPTGAQIVFIAPDDNGVDNIWIADLNDPEHPRQLTFHEQGVSIHNIQVSDKDLLVYMRISRDHRSIWALNMTTGQQEMVRDCLESSSCGQFLLHPQGRWIVSEDTSFLSETSYETRIRLDDLQTHHHDIIYRAETTIQTYLPLTLVSWIQETGLLVYHSNLNRNVNELAFYDVENRQVIKTGYLHEVLPFSPIFSPGGAYYANILYQYEGRYVALVEVYALDETENMMLSTLAEDSVLGIQAATFQDWHPDNDTILIAAAWSHPGKGRTLTELKLYHVIDGSITSLHTTDARDSYFNAQFNYNGRQIIYTIYDLEQRQSQVILFDVETREEIALPLFGRNPQWVNGGR